MVGSFLFKFTCMLDLSFPLVIVQHASAHTPIERPHLKLMSKQRLFIALLEVNLVPPPKSNDPPREKKLVSTWRKFNTNLSSKEMLCFANLLSQNEKNADDITLNESVGTLN